MDQIAELLGTLAFGWLITNYGNLCALPVLTGIAFLALPFEIWAISRVQSCMHVLANMCMDIVILVFIELHTHITIHPEALCNLVFLGMFAGRCMFSACHVKQTVSSGESVLFSKDARTLPGLAMQCIVRPCFQYIVLTIRWSTVQLVP